MLQRVLSTIMPHVDGTFITLNYPDKSKITKTLNWCKKQGIHTSYIKWNKDFSAARNFNLKQIPKSYQWFFWCDIDDRIDGAEHLHEVARMAREKDVKSVFMNYIYSSVRDKEGNIVQRTIEHMRERLLVNEDLYEWVAPIHETLIEKFPTRKADVDQITGTRELIKVVHLSDHKRNKASQIRNIEILEKYYKEVGKKDPRPRHYLAKAYFDTQEPKNLVKAEKLFHDYLSGPNPSGWAEERAQAWEYLSEIYRIWGKYNSSIKCCLNAIEEAPHFPSSYINLALTYTCKKMWDKALHWIKLSTKVPIPKTTMVINQRDLIARSLEVLWHVSINQNNIDEAWAAAKKLSEIFPDSEEIREKYLVGLGLKEQKEATKMFTRLVRYLDAIGEGSKIPLLLRSVPSTIEDNPFVTQIKNRLLPARTWGDDEIAIYCGPGFSSWSPKKLVKPGESFLGGSEEAVVYLSKELADLGWKVTVYADPGEDRGEVDGVNWLPYYEFNHKDNFNILIGWRNVAFFDAGFKSKKNYLWAHDVLNPQDFTQERLGRLDKIIVLSRAHRQTIPNVPSSKILISTNGYTEHFPKLKPKNNPKWCIYTSSYDRGLEHLLKIWPEVVKEVPDAKLHVFYGWKLFEEFYRDNPERMAWKEKMDKMMEHMGITHHGRVPQPEIEKWYKKCGIFAYPSHFYEINCGLPGTPVFTKNGVKNIENVKEGDMVLTHNGNFREVTKTMSRKVNEEVYGIKSAKSPYPIWLTGKHPVYTATYHVRSDAKGNQVYNKDNYKRRWINTADLREGLNYVLTPRGVSGNLKSVKITDYVNGYKEKGGEIHRDWKHMNWESASNKILLNKDFLYMLGLFCADGSVCPTGRKNTLSGIQFAFDKNKPKIIERIKSIFPLKISSITENGCQGVCYQSPMSEFLRATCYAANGEKVIPSFIWDVSLEKQRVFLEGLLDGDGARYRGGISFQNTSRSLAYGVAQILSNLGIFPAFSYSEDRKAYFLYWKENSAANKQHRVEDKHISRKIKLVERKQYKGKVYNFEVEKDNSYVLGNMAVHNCISAFKSELWGAVPVATNYAALDETIQYGKKIKGDIYDPETLEEYKQALIYALKHPEWQEEQRKKMMPWAKDKYSWTNVAKQWSEEFKSMDVDEAIDIVVNRFGKDKVGQFMPLKNQKKHGLKETS